MHSQGGSNINKKFISQIKKGFDFLSDKRLLVGIGIGMIIATLIMTGVNINYSFSSSQIETKARALGMQYPQDFKVINGGGNVK